MTDLSAHPVHAIPPVGDPYVLGRWHRDRVSARGYLLEARVALKALVVRGRPERFLILARPRSGTTLLYRLLDQVPGLECDGEMLHYAVLRPRGLLDSLAGRSRARVYGCKLLSYQMFEVQKIRPEPFFEALHRDGIRLIHMQRNTFSQSISLSTAQGTGEYHAAADAAGTRTEITLDPDRFVQMVRWNLAMLDYERQLLAPYPHLVVDYDRELADGARHQSAIDRICGWLGHPTGPVRADLGRMGARNVVVNRDALRARLLAEGLGAALDPLKAPE